jgi:hypothetical protein
LVDKVAVPAVDPQENLSSIVTVPAAWLGKTLYQLPVVTGLLRRWVTGTKTLPVFRVEHLGACLEAQLAPLG